MKKLVYIIVVLVVFVTGSLFAGSFPQNIEDVPRDVREDLDRVVSSDWFATLKSGETLKLTENQFNDLKSSTLSYIFSKEGTVSTVRSKNTILVESEVGGAFCHQVEQASDSGQMFPEPSGSQATFNQPSAQLDQVTKSSEQESEEAVKKQINSIVSSEIKKTEEEVALLKNQNSELLTRLQEVEKSLEEARASFANQRSEPEAVDQEVFNVHPANVTKGEINQYYKGRDINMISMVSGKPLAVVNLDSPNINVNGQPVSTGSLLPKLKPQEEVEVVEPENTQQATQEVESTDSAPAEGGFADMG